MLGFTQFIMSKKQIALMITGAAARISQEVACIDKLIETKGLTINEDNTLLAGFSSGSLNLLALNACFRKNSPLNWDEDYKNKVLWQLTNAKVYTKQHGLHTHVFDTSPLRETLNGFLSAMGATWFGDLTFDSFVLTFSDHKLTTEWAKQFGNNNQQNLNASDLFMASTAIPIAFPWQEINAKPNEEKNFPNGHFSDGGTGGQFKGFETYIGQYVKDNGIFEDLHIVSPMREASEESLAALHKGLDGQSLEQDVKEHLSNFASNSSFSAFVKFLIEIQDWEKTNGKLAQNIYVSIPRMEKNFGILDFNSELEQYKATCNWIDQNPGQFAMPIASFIDQHTGG